MYHNATYSIPQCNIPQYKIQHTIHHTIKRTIRRFIILPQLTANVASSLPSVSDEFGTGFISSSFANSFCLISSISLHHVSIGSECTSRAVLMLEGSGKHNTIISCSVCLFYFTSHISIFSQFVEIKYITPQE